ncbi:MAG: hypothetical protein NTY30_03955 [Candidatus Berkelbacteria bacterium]|nr:hypothetical protein [Candidatus Berkelbacteria bacterium]
MEKLSCNLDNTNWENIRVGARKYIAIMQMVKNTNVRTDESFRRAFNGFYRIRQRSKEFYDFLYEYLERNKEINTSFKQTLYSFYEKFQRLEPSFSSKIVATINPNFPVWDSEVLARFGKRTLGHNLNKDIRLKEMVKIYSEISDWYAEFLETDQAKAMIGLFDQKIGKLEITDIKKIDLILWQTRS